MDSFAYFSLLEAGIKISELGRFVACCMLSVFRGNFHNSDANTALLTILAF